MPEIIRHLRAPLTRREQPSFAKLFLFRRSVKRDRQKLLFSTKVLRSLSQEVFVLWALALTCTLSSPPSQQHGNKGQGVSQEENGRSLLEQRKRRSDVRTKKNMSQHVTLCLVSKNPKQRPFDGAEHRSIVSQLVSDFSKMCEHVHDAVSHLLQAKAGLEGNSWGQHQQGKAIVVRQTWQWDPQQVSGPHSSGS